MSDPNVALATTKRKFYELLDSLTANKSTSSLAGSLHGSSSAMLPPSTPKTPRTEPPVKRTRVLNGSPTKARSVSGDKVKQIQSTLLARQRSNDPHTPSSTRIVHGNFVKSFAGSPTPQQPVNYAPYSQEHFLSRLKTFADVKKWTMKPEKLSEIEWAKRGWVCEDWNKVACKGGCEKRLFIKLLPKMKDENGDELDGTEDYDVEVEQDLVKKYQDLIITGHEEGCLWRTQGCRGKRLFLFSFLNYALHGRGALYN
jgi:hypothetical protein